jgi:integrase
VEGARPDGDEEPRLLVLGAGTRGRAAASAAVRLASPPIAEAGAPARRYRGLCRRDLRPNRHKAGEVHHRAAGSADGRPRASQVVVPVPTACRDRRRGRHPRPQDAYGATHRGPVGARPHRQPEAVQKLLGHSSITTTGDIYTNWDIDQLEATMRYVIGEGSSDYSADNDL